MALWISTTALPPPTGGTTLLWRSWLLAHRGNRERFDLGGLKMSVYEIDPLSDHRWHELLQQHPRASVFHSCAWLDALKQTYEYEPVAYTTTAPGAPLKNGWVFCRIRSWLTGRRLVSLPFS